MERRLLAEYEGDLGLILQLACAGQDRGGRRARLGAGADPRLRPCEAGQCAQGGRRTEAPCRAPQCAGRRSRAAGRRVTQAVMHARLCKRPLKPFLRRTWHAAASAAPQAMAEIQGQRRPGRHLYPVRQVVVQRRDHPGRRRVLSLPDRASGLRAYSKPIYLVLAGLMLAAGLYRYYGIRKYQKIDITGNYAAALKAENYYLVGGTIQGFFLGLFCFVAIYWTPDIYGEIASVWWRWARPSPSSAATTAPGRWSRSCR